MFRYLITIACLLIWGTTSWISVQALASFLTDGGFIIYAMGAGMELGKLLVIIHIHRIWNDTGMVQRFFYCGLAGILILLTACEVLGFLSQGFAGATSGHRSDQAGLASLQSEKAVLQDQIRLIEETIAGLPEGYVSKRVSIRKKTGYEEKVDRLLELTQQESVLAVKLAGDVKQAGPVYAVASITGVDVGSAAVVFIAILVGVLEMLSAGLAVAVSAVWKVDPIFCGSQPEAEIKVDPIFCGSQPEAGIKVDPIFCGAQPEAEIKVDPILCGSQSKPETLPSKSVEPEKTDVDTEPEALTNHEQLMAILDKYSLSARHIAEITGRKQIDTVKGWLARNGPDIPDKALRQLSKYVRENPVRLVAEG